LSISIQNIKNNITRLFKKGNVDEITKKDIFIGVMSSPITLLIIVTLVYSIKMIGYYLSDDTSLSMTITLNTPFLMSLFPFSIYSYFIYKYKTFYISFTGDLIITSLSFIAYTSLCLLISLLSNKYLELIWFIFMITVIFVSFMIFLGAKKAAFQLEDLNTNKKFKLAFIDFNNFDKVVTFINKSNIFYYTQYVKINGCKISYSDINIFENQFNKKVYDFNKDEMNVVSMYLIK
jgi:hypothetical protein